MTRFAAASLALVMTTCSACTHASPTAPPGPRPEAPPSHVLSGFVFADAPAPRTPIDGAHVRVDTAFGRIAVVTDRNGMYRVAGLPPGNSSVLTTMIGYDTKTVVVTLTGDTELEIQIVPAQMRTLSGYVFETTSEGRVPVRDARLHWSELHYDATSDAQGFYKLTLFRGNSPFLASKDGYWDTTLQISLVDDRQVDIELVKR